MPDAAASEFARQASLRRRLPRALRRRWAGYWSRWRGGHRLPTAEAAFDALVRGVTTAEQRPHAGGRSPCILTLGRAIATAARFGQLDVASEWSRPLLGVQRGDGSFSDSAGQPSRFHTAQALRGLAALHAARSEADRWADSGSSVTLGALAGGTRRAASYLASQFDASGLPHLCDAAPGSIDRWGPKSLALAWLPPLCAAARALDEPAWEHLARRSLRRQLNAADVTRWNGPTNWWAHATEALVELGESALTRIAIRHPAACQTARGAVPAMPGEEWISGAGLAILASVWCQLGTTDDRAHGDRALAALTRQQLPSGGLPATWGCSPRSEQPSEQPEECALTTALYLEAVHGQARCPLASSVDAFPAEIDAADGRLAAVLDWCRVLGPSPRIIDLGCGKGRYLRHLRQQLPQAKLIGVDVSPATIARLPPDVTGRQGDLLRIPAGDGEFDGAICIEALEHALLPARAGAEICRVVRPGGAILIIDKHRSHQALSDHQPWERWFEPREVTAWLSVYGERVEARPLPHGEHLAPTGLFWCWTAVRRAGDSHRRAA